MGNISLARTMYKGSLLVRIRGVGEHRSKYHVFPVKLLTFVANVYAALTRRGYRVAEEDWKVSYFSPQEGVLEVEKV